MIPLFKVHMPESVFEPLKAVLMSGYIGQGPKVDAFEKALVPWLGHPNILSLNSGTSALYLALKLAGVDYQDEVISSPQSCMATNTPIIDHKAKIVWADIDPWTGNIDPVDVERKITTRTKAILAVHWGGYPCELNELTRISKKYGIPLIEDAAHSFGSAYQGRKIGSISQFTCFSFQAIKHLTSVTPDTRVLVRRNGIVSIPCIGDLDSTVIGQECASFEQSGIIRWAKISDFIKHPIDDVILTIRTEKGRKVKVTRSHSVFVFDGTKFVAKVAGDLKTGDWLAMPRRLPMSGGPTKIDLIELIKDLPLVVKNGRIRMGYEGRGANAGKWTDRFVNLTPAFCKILGYYAAEGSIALWSRNGKASKETKYVTFSFGAHEEKTHVQELMDLLKEVFPSYTPQKYRTKKPDTGMKVVFGSTLFAEIVERMNGGVGAHNKRIPDLLWEASDECKLSFIEGLMNGDGHRRNLKGQMEHETLVSCSEELAAGLHYLLLSIGIQSSLEIKNSKKDGKSFRSYVCTIINRRAYGYQDRCRENMVPAVFVSGLKKAKICVPMSRIVEDNLQCPPQLLKDVCLLRITDIETNPYRGDVYDFSVEGPQNFIGGYGGFCLHNTIDGGALVCASNDAYREGKLLRWYGIDRETPKRDMRCEDDVKSTGGKMHMNDVCATVGLEQLNHVAKIVKAHRENAAYYDKALEGLKNVKKLKYQADRESAFWLYTIRVKSQQGFFDFMAANDVMVSKVHVRNDVHTCFKEFRRNLPGVDEFASSEMCIPVGWWVTPADREKIAGLVVKWDKEA